MTPRYASVYSAMQRDMNLACHEVLRDVELKEISERLSTLGHAFALVEQIKPKCR
jgi:hypothetical protein